MRFISSGSVILSQQLQIKRNLALCGYVLFIVVNVYLPITKRNTIRQTKYLETYNQSDLNQDFVCEYN